MAVFTAGAGTSVEPLAIIEEGQVAGAAMRVPLNCIDLCRAKRRDSKSLHAAAEKEACLFFLKLWL